MYNYITHLCCTDTMQTFNVSLCCELLTLFVVNKEPTSKIN